MSLRSYFSIKASVPHLSSFSLIFTNPFERHATMELSEFCPKFNQPIGPDQQMVVVR